jgi:isocitrate dehydrogenase (NAD+)
MRRITLIEGDGIGPEVTRAVVTILETAGLRAEWEPQLAGVRAIETFESPLPKELLDSIDRNKVALKGPVTTPVGGDALLYERVPSRRLSFSLALV